MLLRGSTAAGSNRSFGNGTFQARTRTNSSSSALNRLLHHPLTPDHRAARFARLCRWQIASHLRREVIVPWVGGMRLAARRGMTGATGNIYAGLHEFADMAFTLHFLRPDDLFLDVGANVGSYTLLASGVCKARTISFEPDPQTMALLRRNIDLNGLDGRVLVEQTAVGAEDGEVEFTLGREATTMRLDEPGRVAAR